jgi:hypothetical protein
VLVLTGAGVPKAICNITSVDDSSQATFEFLAGASGVTDLSTIVIGDWVVKTGSTDNSSNAQMVQNSAFRAEPQGLLGILGYGGPLDGNGRAAEVGADFAGGGIEGTDNGAWQWGGTDDRTSTTGNYFQGLACTSAAAGWNSELAFNQGVVNHNSGSLRTPTENLLMQIIDEVEERNSAEIQVWLSSYAPKRVYSAQLTGEKRFVNTVNLPGGWDRTMVGPGGIPWLVDRLHPKNNIHGLSLEQGGFQNWVTEPLSWASEQGANIWQYLQDMDRYQARTVEECTLGVGVRDRCGVRIMDIEES